MEQPDDSYSEIRETCKMAEVSMIKSISDGTDIQYCFLNELKHGSKPTIFAPAFLMVGKGNAETVKELLKDKL